MALINVPSREINCKIVYYGPGLCGKTTNLQHIYEKTPNLDPAKKLISLKTADTDRTLYFDFLPLFVGEIQGYKTRFHLYTVPGQVYFAESRKLILRNVDGIVFVADSQIERMEANLESMDNLRENATDYNATLNVTVPYVIQYNKRDRPNAAGVDEMRRLLNTDGVMDFEATANTGVGVFETLKAVSKLVLQNLSRDSAGAQASSSARRGP